MERTLTQSGVPMLENDHVIESCLSHSPVPFAKIERVRDREIRLLGLLTQLPTSRYFHL